LTEVKSDPSIKFLLDVPPLIISSPLSEKRPEELLYPNLSTDEPLKPLTEFPCLKDGETPDRSPEIPLSVLSLPPMNSELQTGVKCATEAGWIFRVK
jgi:hypothetical protein